MSNRDEPHDREKTMDQSSITPDPDDVPAEATDITAESADLREGDLDEVSGGGFWKSLMMPHQGA
jgi:hypothetical protein